MTPTDTPQYPYDRGALLDERNTYPTPALKDGSFYAPGVQPDRTAAWRQLRAPQGRMWFRARPIRYWLA